MFRIPKTILAVIAAGVASTALTCQHAQAAMVNGVVTFAGGAIFDTMDLATATQVTAFTDVTVQSRDGDFASFVNVGDAVTMATTYTFVPSTPTPGLWSVGGFTFDLANSVVELQNSNFLLITGSGTISGNGFDATPGMWSFTSQSPAAGGIFSFSAVTSGTGVPEGGATVALLGLGFCGIELARRKLKFA
ncbi:MAG: hypothetical protein H0X34_18075 [Chthoniobacterales bacterium]|jgi:hypothetical protein|nr:hypothetical protein [Chthoniobacterales bacterium]